MNQLSFPVELSSAEIGRKRSLGSAIELCAEAGGKEPKEIQADLAMDKAQFSRWTSGSEGVVWPKFAALMDYCGNDAPLFWMVQARGFDLSSLRRVETGTEKLLRLSREENAALRRALGVAA